MNIISYVKNFGHVSLEERKFDEVDALVFCAFSYIEFEKCVPSIKEKHKGVRLSEIDESKVNFGDIKPFNNDRKELLKAMKSCFRYKDILLHNVDNKFSILGEIQFFAFSYTLPSGHEVICFRGTDESIVGWKEDLGLAFEHRIPSHQAALDYAETIFKKTKHPVLFTGHSKGGNLAFYCMVELFEKYDERIIYSINFDGPGFIDKDFIKKAKQAHIYEKLIKLVPKCSIVGMLLNHHKHIKIVDSDKMLLLQHDPNTWVINENGNFKYEKHRMPFSLITEKAVSEWIDSIEEKDKKILANLIVYLFGGITETVTFTMLKPLKSFRRMYKRYKASHPEEKAIAKKHIFNLFKIYTKTIKQYRLAKKKKVVSKLKARKKELRSAEKLKKS